MSWDKFMIGQCKLAVALLIPKMLLQCACTVVTGVMLVMLLLAVKTGSFLPHTVSRLQWLEMGVMLAAAVKMTGWLHPTSPCPAVLAPMMPQGP